MDESSGREVLFKNILFMVAFIILSGVFDYFNKKFFA